MATKLTDVFKSLRVIPVPFGEYCRSGGANDELPSIMTDYRLPSAQRTVRIVLKSDQCLFIDRDTISRNSRICAAEIERQEKEGAEVVIRLENVFLHHMERVLFAISPTVYGQYPIPPTIFDVCAICPVAQALEMDMLVSLCQQILENDVHTELIPLRLLIDFFNTAYKCQLKLALQATLFARILERNYNEMSYTCVRRLKSLCLRIFLWNYVTTNRYFERVRRERKQNCFIPKKESWTVPNRNDLQQEKLIRLCTYDALRLSHLTTTVSTEILRISCSQCKKERSRITRAGSFLSKPVPKKLFLCQQCGSELCADCEAKFCSAMLMDLLKNVRKAEEEPDMEKKLREIVHANSSPYDCTWRLLNA